jgi:hypothetical protein
MKYKDIKMFTQRCEEHPDHQTGMISNRMVIQRLNEEIDELREYIEQREWVGLTDEQIEAIAKNYALGNPTTPLHFARAIEAKLREKNT